MPETPLTSDHAGRAKSSVSAMGSQKPKTTSADDDYLLLGDKIEQGYIVRTQQRRARGNVVPKPARASYSETQSWMVLFNLIYASPFVIPLVPFAYWMQQGHWLSIIVVSISGLFLTLWFGTRFFLPMQSDMNKMFGFFGQHGQYVERGDVSEMFAFYRARLLGDVKTVTGRLHA